MVVGAGVVPADVVVGAAVVPAEVVVGPGVVPTLVVVGAAVVVVAGEAAAWAGTTMNCITGLVHLAGKANVPSELATRAS